MRMLGFASAVLSITAILVAALLLFVLTLTIFRLPTITVPGTGLMISPWLLLVVLFFLEIFLLFMRFKVLNRTAIQ